DAPAALPLPAVRGRGTGRRPRGVERQAAPLGHRVGAPGVRRDEGQDRHGRGGGRADAVVLVGGAHADREGSVGGPRVLGGDGGAAGGGGDRRAVAPVDAVGEPGGLVGSGRVGRAERQGGGRPLRDPRRHGGHRGGGGRVGGGQRGGVDVDGRALRDLERHGDRPGRPVTQPQGGQRGGGDRGGLTGGVVERAVVVHVPDERGGRARGRGAAVQHQVLALVDEVGPARVRHHDGRRVGHGDRRGG